MGRGKIDVVKLDIRDAGGDVTEQGLPAVYEGIEVDQKPRQDNPWEQSIGGKMMWVYSSRAKLTPS